MPLHPFCYGAGDQAQGFNARYTSTLPTGLHPQPLRMVFCLVPWSHPVAEVDSELTL